MILITGGTGYIGKNLINRLPKDNVRCMVHKNTIIENLDSDKIISGDILDLNSIEKALDNVDTVIHLAAVISPENKETYDLVNVIGTKNIVESCKKKNIKRIIFTSSMASTRKFLDDYGSSKKKAEEIIKDSKLDYTILRLTTVYGLNSPFTTNLINHIKRFPFIIPLIGNGENKIQPVSIDDVISVIQKCIENKNTIGKTYSILGGTKITLNYFIDFICSKLNINKKKIHVPIPLALKMVKILKKSTKNINLTEEFIKGFL